MLVIDANIAVRACGRADGFAAYRDEEPATPPNERTEEA
jgi:hypothetical protein